MACDPCRASKIRCRPSEQPGVCFKCLETKKECVSRAGPQFRQQRHRRHAGGQVTAQPPPVASSTATFSLDFAVPAQHPVDDAFETLRASHSWVLDAIFPPDSRGPSLPVNPSTGVGSATPSTSSSEVHSIQDLRARPQFSLSSAEYLMSSFRTMLPHFPCILLPAETSVPQLAASRPFVLLAILSAASGSRTLQGHSLYDEEFRKVLGLKFMAGGERSLDLLQGILIYCAWYPFHLRPNMSQILQFVQYIRVASELVHDLELDKGNEYLELSPIQEVRDQQLDKMRVYLGYCYMVSSAMFSWKKQQGLVPTFTPWTTVCCDTLDRHAQGDGDRILVSLVRLANIVHDAAESIPGRNVETAQQSRLIWLSLEAQAKGIQGDLDPVTAAAGSMRIAAFYTDIFLSGGTKMKFPGVSGPASHRPEFLHPSVSSLAACAKSIGGFFNYMLSLDRPSFLLLSGIDWTRLIAVIILSIRLSFQMRECPEWDASWARSEMRLGEFLASLCVEPHVGTAPGNTDVLSASRVVMSMVKEKYDLRVSLESASTQDLPQAAAAHVGCPMLDGSMNQYIPAWNGEFDASLTMPPEAAGAPGTSMEPGQNAPIDANPLSGAENQPFFPDPWTTIARGWPS